MSRKAIIFILTISCLTTQAQNFRSRIEAMQTEYATIDRVSIVMRIKAFDKQGSGTPFFEETAILKRDKKNYYYKFSGTEMIMNEKYLLMVDESSRQIVCTKRSIKKEEKFDDPFVANLDSILGLYEKPEFKGLEKSIEQYSITQKTGAIKVIDVFVDIDQNIIKRLNYWYENGPFVSIEFEQFRKDPQFTETDFSESKFITLQKGQLKTTPLYSRFNLSVN